MWQLSRWLLKYMLAVTTFGSDHDDGNRVPARRNLCWGFSPWWLHQSSFHNENFHKYQVQWEKVTSFEFAPKMESSQNGVYGGAWGVIEAGQSLLNDQTFPMIPLNWGDGEEEFEGRAIFSLLDLDDNDVDDGGVGGWHDVWGSVHNFLHRDSPTFPISSSPLSTSSLLSYLIMKTESILRRNILN